MADSKKLSLYEKLIEIRKTCTYLKKDTEGHQYNFVSSSQTLGALRTAMDEFGVLLVPEITAHEKTSWNNSNGKLQIMTELTIKYRWINAEKPDEVLESMWYAQGLDNAEKGVGKAVTYGEKYFLLKFFQIATDKDDPDVHANKHRAPDPPPPPATPPPPPPDPPPPIVSNKHGLTPEQLNTREDIGRMMMEMWGNDKLACGEALSKQVGRNCGLNDLTATEILNAIPKVALEYKSWKSPQGDGLSF